MNSYFQPWEAVAGSFQAKKNDKRYHKLLMAVDPLGDEVILRFREGQMKAVYQSLDESTRPWFVNEDSHCRLEADHEGTPAQLYAALHAFSTHLQDVRFMVVEYEANRVDEVYIKDGVLYLHRHNKSGKSFEKKILFFETLLSAHPEDTSLKAFVCDTFQKATLIYIKDGSYDEAEKFIQKAMRHTTPDDARILYLKGKTAYEQKNMTVALALYKEAVRPSGNIFELHFELGIIQAIYEPDFEEAIRNLTIALELKECTDIYHYRALAKLRNGDQVAAEEDLDKYMAKIQPHNNHAPASAAQWYADLGYRTQAATLYKTALNKNLQFENELKASLNPHHSDRYFYEQQLAQNTALREEVIIHGLGSTGYAAQNLGQYELALDCNEAILRAVPDHPHATIAKGFAYEYLGQNEAAISCFEKAITLKPKGQMHVISSALASCYNNKGALDKAIAMANRAIKQDPAYYHPYYILACVYAKQQQPALAVPMIQKALAIDPSQRSLIENEPDLAELIKAHGHEF